MTLKNITRNNIVLNDIQLAESLLSCSIGLIGSKSNTGLMFETHWGIHTFFMTRAIDVMVLDSDMIVRRLRTALPPYRFFFYPPRYKTIIELPQGTIASTHTKLGDKMTVIK